MRTTTIAVCLLLGIAGLAEAKKPKKAKAKKTTVIDAADYLAADHRQVIQDAIDNAKPMSTIELVGTFELDGTPIVFPHGLLTLQGREIDNDGDGAVNEDWADGVDNDDDGFTDEDGWDATLQGLTTLSGAPESDPGVLWYNAGIIIEGIVGAAPNLAIRGIEFTGLIRSIAMTTDYITAPGVLCENVVSTGGKTIGTVIENNHFDNFARGVQGSGESKGLVIRQNLFTSGGGLGVLLVGDSLCDDGTGARISFGSGQPTDTEIHGNTFEVAVIGVWTAETESTSIRDNEFAGSFYGLLLDTESNATAENNVISDSFYGIWLQLDSVGTQVNGNLIDGSTYGVVFIEAGNYTASANVVTNSAAADYYLDADSYDNVINLFDGSETVLDFGTNNTVNSP